MRRSYRRDEGGTRHLVGVALLHGVVHRRPAVAPDALADRDAGPGAGLGALGDVVTDVEGVAVEQPGDPAHGATDKGAAGAPEEIVMHDRVLLVLGALWVVQ